jgi:hypothetical protein
MIGKFRIAIHFISGLINNHLLPLSKNECDEQRQAAASQKHAATTTSPRQRNRPLVPPRPPPRVISPTLHLCDQRLLPIDVKLIRRHAI